MNVNFFKGVGFICLIFSSFCSVAQERVEKDSIIRSLRNLRNSINKIDCPGGSKDKEISMELLNEQILAINQTEINFPTQYLTSFNYLRSLTEKISTADEKNFNLPLIRRDLELKFKAADDTINISGSPNNSLATVKIITKNGLGQVQNLRVKCTPIGFRINFNAPLYTFSSLTSPSTQDLVPGVYLFWVSRDGNNEVLGQVKSEVKPGMVTSIDLTVP